MAFRIIALLLMAAFYACYFIKLIGQKKKRIKTTQIGSGKTGFVKFIECTMMASTILVVVVELGSIALRTSILSDFARWVGAGIGFLGVAVFITAVITMRDSWRAGVSKTDQTELVTSGIFAISRNPAFLGFDLLYIGILLMFFNWVLLAASSFAALMFHLQIVNVEEDFLQEAFGEEYLRYKKSVNRYFGRKGKKRAILTVLVCVLLFAGWIGWRTLSDYSRVLDANWGISLPFKALYSEIYEKDSGASFHGDGIRYHVFSYRYEDYIDLMFAWRANEGKTLFRDSYSETAEEWLDEIEVPRGWRPDYESCSYWYKTQEDNSQIIIFWDSEENRLYIVEQFI